MMSCLVKVVVMENKTNNQENIISDNMETLQRIIVTLKKEVQTEQKYRMEHQRG